MSWTLEIASKKTPSCGERLARLLRLIEAVAGHTNFQKLLDMGPLSPVGQAAAASLEAVMAFWPLRCFTPPLLPRRDPDIIA